MVRSQMAAQYGNDIGALCPSYDKPEQGLDILQDAITSLELTPGEDFFIALNLTGKEIFDYVGNLSYQTSRRMRVHKIQLFTQLS